MAWSLIASAENDADAAGTTLDTLSSLNVAAGDLLVAWCKYEGANGTFAVAKDSGSPANTFTFDAGDEVNNGNGDLNASFGYVLSAAADATATFRFTTESRSFRGVIIYQFRPDAGETVTKDASNVGSGFGIGTVASGTIDTSGTDEVVFGGYAQYTGQTLSNREINNVAADGFEDNGSTDHSVWYRILSATFSGGTAEVTQDVTQAWICNVIAFKSEAASGQPPRTMQQSRLRRAA